MSIARFLKAAIAVALGSTLGCISFMVLVFVEDDRGAMNDVFAGNLGVGYLLPPVVIVFLATVLGTVLMARHSGSLARLFGLSAVAVLGVLLVLAALLTSHVPFALLGLATAVIGTVVVLSAVKGMQRGAV